MKNGVRKSTQAGYKTVVNVLKKEGFGSRKISDIRISDAKLWLIQMQKSGRGYTHYSRRTSTSFSDGS